MNVIDEKLNSIINSKLDIKSAITEKGVSGITEILATYGDKIREIQGGSGEKIYEVETTWDLEKTLLSSITLPEELMILPEILKTGVTTEFEIKSYHVKTNVEDIFSNHYELPGSIIDIIYRDQVGFCHSAFKVIFMASPIVSNDGEKYNIGYSLYAPDFGITGWSQTIFTTYTNVELTNLTVTKNGIYTAQESEAYSKVTVNVMPLQMTQAEYDALSVKDPNQIYIIKD